MGTAPGGKKCDQTATVDPTSRRERTRTRMRRGEERRERNLITQELEGAFTHSGGEVGRRRKILHGHGERESVSRCLAD